MDGDKALFNENNKRVNVMKGNAEFAITKVNAADGEIGAVSL